MLEKFQGGITLGEVGEGDWVVGQGKEAVAMDGGQAFCCMGGSIREYPNRSVCLSEVEDLLMIVGWFLGGDVEVIIGNGDWVGCLY